MANLRYYTRELTLTVGQSKTERFSQIDDLAGDTPFKNVIIINNDQSADLKAYINSQDQYILIPSGTIRNLENQRVSAIRFENVSGSNPITFSYEVNNFTTQVEMLKILAGMDLEARQ